MKNITLETIHKDLEHLKKIVEEIRESTIYSAAILEEDDLTALEDYEREKKEGKLTSHEELKKELGL